jgi:hypothetical protein
MSLLATQLSPPAAPPRFGWLLPLVLYAALSLLYFFAIPVGESPDEPGHLQCIEQVALAERLPLQEPNPQGVAWWSRERVTSGYMCYHMPLYYVAMGWWVERVAALTDTGVTFEFPPSNPTFEQTAVMFTHTNKPTLWALPEPPALWSMRLIAMALGAVVVWGSYMFARRLLPQQPLAPILAAVLVAGWPQFLFLSRSINNDGLATALAVGVLIVLSNIGRPWRYVAACLLVLLALLTKVSVGFVLGAVVILWLAEWWAFRAERPLYVRSGLVGTAVLLAGLALIWLNPTLQNHFFRSARAFSGIAPAANTLAYWGDVLEQTGSSGWARLGWMNVVAPMEHALFWWLLLLSTAVAGWVWLLRHTHTTHARLLLLLLVTWLLLALVSYFRINLNRLQPQFRFLFPIIPMLTALVVAGILPGSKQGWQQWSIVVVTAVALAAYNIWLVFSLVRTVYGWSF